MTAPRTSRGRALRRLRRRIIAGETGRGIDWDIWYWLGANGGRGSAHPPPPGYRRSSKVGMTPCYTSSLEETAHLHERVLPGWFATCGHCALSGHATVGPDYNGPEGDRLHREFPSDWGGLKDAWIFDVDLEGDGGTARRIRAWLVAIVEARIAITERTAA